MKKISLLLSVLVLFGLTACEQTLPEDETITRHHQVQTGSNHTLLLTADGELYTWGSSLYGVLGNNETSVDISYNEPINITENFNLENDETIDKIYAGLDFNFAITSNHRVFAWGNNNYSNLGFSPSGLVLTPFEITNYLGLNEGETIEHISINWHSFILTSEHRVIAFGNNLDGQIGNMKQTSMDDHPGELFTNITDNFFLDDEEKVIFVMTENNKSWAITSAFRVFIWGTINTTQIATFPIDKDVAIELNEGEKIIDIGSPNIPSFKTNQGRFFVIGTELILPENRLSLIALPMSNYLNLEASDSIKAIYLSQNNPRNNRIIVTHEGLILPWGSNAYGELGYDAGRNVSVIPPFYDESETYVSIHENFSLSEGENVVQLSYGRNHIILVTSHNNVFTWGRNTYGTLGNGTFEDSMLPIKITLD